MKILILDDEPPARRGLKSALHGIGVTDVRDVGTVDHALQAILEDKPDVLLLDVELRGGKKGFDLLEKLPAKGIPVIFITAHPEHAVRAFEVSAVDYLLKPVDPQRLSQALTKLGATETREEKPFSRDEKVLFRDGSKNVLIRIGDIHALEASEAYTRIILGDGTGLTVNGTLKSVLQRLDPDLFFPANRTHAINLDHVAKVDDGAVGLTITMTNNLQLELSRRQSIEFRRLKSI